MQRSMRRCVIAASVACLVWSVGCHRNVHHLDLQPKDPRPVYRVHVEDGDEASLLSQQLKVEPVRLDGPYLYLIGTPTVLTALAQNGYIAEQVDPYTTNYRVVEVRKRGTEARLLATGVSLINRESDHWVVRGSLTQLKNLELAGYTLRNIAHEPRPREVQIRVKTREQIQSVSQLPVDIYTVHEDREGFLIDGGAFDAQIDALKREGYAVTIRPTVPPPVKPRR